MMPIPNDVQPGSNSADALTALLDFLKTLQMEGEPAEELPPQNPFEEPMTPERGALQVKNVEQNDPLQGLKYALRTREIPPMAAEVAKLGG